MKTFVWRAKAAGRVALLTVRAATIQGAIHKAHDWAMEQDMPQRAAYWQAIWGTSPEIVDDVIVDLSPDQPGECG